MVNSFLASGFKNSTTPFDASIYIYISSSLVYNRSTFQIFNITIFSGIKFMCFNSFEKIHVIHVNSWFFHVMVFEFGHCYKNEVLEK